MFKQTKRFVAILLSVLMIVSSFSVVAYAEEAVPEEQPPFSMTQSNAEAISINKGDQKIGTANYYLGTGAKDWMDEEEAFLNGLVAEDTVLLNYGKPSVNQYVKNADGTYTAGEGTAADKILNNDYASNNIQNGKNINVELGKFQDREADGSLKVDADGNPVYLENVITKQYGWDGAFYYYDEWKGEKKRDESVTTPYAYEAYTYRLGAGTKVSDIVIAGSAGANLRTTFYEIYMTTGAAENVYDAENLVYTFNGHEYETVPIAQHYSFNNVEASTIGIKVIDTTNACQIGQPYYMCAPRIGMLDIYGTNEKALLNVSVSDAQNAMKSVSQTTVDETDNYSIPAALNAKDPLYGPAHRYYRNNTPYYAGATVVQNGASTIPRMWDSITNADIQQDGREAYKDGDNIVFFEDTTTYCYYDFEDIYEINEIRLGNHNSVALRYSDVTVYAGNDFESLFTEENKLTYIPNAFGSASVAAQGLEARYVGIKVGDTCWENEKYPANDYLRMTEFDVLGKFKADADAATVKNYNTTGLTDTFQPVRDDMAGKVSLVKENPTVAFYNGDDVKLTAADTMKLVDGSIGSEFKTDDLPHVDAEGNYVEGADVYTSVKYDLKKVEEVSEIVVASSSNEYSKAAFYKVYVSEDAEITAEDEVAAVLNAGAHEYYKNCAQMLTLPEGTKGQYVEVRFFAPLYSASDVKNGAPNASTIYLKLQELNVYGDKGYKIESGSKNRADYFNTYKDTKIKDSLIANTSIFDAENIAYINYGTKQPDAPYQGTKCVFGSEEWAELSKGLTVSDYYNMDGDWTGVSYTETVYPCSGETAHKADCPADDTCKGVARIIRGDDTLYQTVIYKLPTRSTITEADIFINNIGVRLPSHYQISFANTRADLFTDKATTFDVNKIVQKSYDLITFDEAVTARYFAVRVLCGVHPSIEGTTNTGSNYARVQHMAIQGESLACADNAHTYDWVADTEPTCSVPGSMHEECTECGVESGETKEIETVPHTENDGVVTTEPTCTEKGVKTFSCTVCGEVIRTEDIETVPHVEGEGVVTKEPTCTEKGVMTYSCTVGGEVLRTEDIETVPHAEGEGVVTTEPTCTENGVRTFYCTAGGEVLRTEEIDSIGHNYNAVVTAPTCTKDGYTTYTCENCGDSYTEVVSKKAHTPVKVAAKAATCTATGLTEGEKCSVCGTITKAQSTIAKKAHNYENKVTAATTSKNGKTYKQCKVCKATASTVTVYAAKTVKLSKTTYTYTGKTIKPTVVVKDSKGKTISSKYYTVSGTQSTKKIGQFKITVKFKGNYSGSKTLTYTVNPKAVAGLKLKAGKKQMTVSFKKDSSVGGYEIVYATSKNFKSGKKTVKITKASTAKKVISKLKSKKTYYVKVRSFKKVSGKTYYGAYTSVKSVKVK